MSTRRLTGLCAHQGRTAELGEQLRHLRARRLGAQSRRRRQTLQLPREHCELGFSFLRSPYLSEKESERLRAKRRYEARTAAGLCRRCGREPSLTGRTRCDGCATVDRVVSGQSSSRTGYGARYYRANRDRYRDWYYCRKYGLSLVAYEDLLQRQGGVCAICQKPPRQGRRLDVDHDHGTGSVRGLLCASCNTAIGHLRESHEILRSAISYLQRASLEPDVSQGLAVIEQCSAE